MNVEGYLSVARLALREGGSAGPRAAGLTTMRQGAGLGDDGAETVSRRLIDRLQQSGRRLLALNLSLNAIGDVGAGHLLAALGQCPAANLRSVALQVRRVDSRRAAPPVRVSAAPARSDSRVAATRRRPRARPRHDGSAGRRGKSIHYEVYSKPIFRSIAGMTARRVVAAWRARGARAIRVAVRDRNPSRCSRPEPESPSDSLSETGRR